jgi:hypothetical protein
MTRGSFGTLLPRAYFLVAQGSILVVQCLQARQH